MGTQNVDADTNYVPAQGEIKITDMEIYKKQLREPAEGQALCIPLSPKAVPDDLIHDLNAYDFNDPYVMKFFDDLRH